MHSIELPHFESGSNPVQPITHSHSTLTKPFNQWPLWAISMKAISLLTSNDDKGVGDTVERTIGKTNSAKYKAWHFATFGKSCGCTSRQSRWNAEYSYFK